MLPPVVELPDKNKQEHKKNASQDIACRLDRPHATFKGNLEANALDWNPKVFKIN